MTPFIRKIYLVHSFISNRS